MMNRQHFILARGSPPQVRGKRQHFYLFGRATRITPAGAGKTIYNRMGKIQNKDHPRRCGENAKLMLNSLYGKGSPPQVRGKLNSPEVRIADHRITPAGAGKTLEIPMDCILMQDHPRRCGEN